jgi:PPM family protein phosphatase
VLTRCIQAGRIPKVDVRCVGCLPDDVYLLCSDGLRGCVPAERIVEILRVARSAASHCDHLVQAALDAGGRDNVGVAVVRVLTSELWAGKPRSTLLEEDPSPVSS